MINRNMNIKIYYCVVWNYKPSAVSLATELKASFGVDSELLSGEKGDFEVVVDGKTVFSKKKLSRFPEPGEVTETLREWIFKSQLRLQKTIKLQCLLYPHKNQQFVPANL